MASEILEGTVTVLITDVEGSTDLFRRIGDEAAKEIVATHEMEATREVERHGGRRIKGMGDGVMAAFTSARRAIRCAAAIQKKSVAEKINGEVLSIKVGLNTGEVSEEGGDIFGQAVNAAARIASVAKGGEVLISEVTKTLAGGVPELDISSMGSVELKGFDEPWVLYRVTWTPEAARARPDVAPYVGRSAELAELRSLMEEARGGKGVLVMLAGEPGVGKTRLAEELAKEADESGMLALRGRSYEMEGVLPFLPFVEILEGARRSVDKVVLREALGDAAGEVARIVPELRRDYTDIPPALDLPPEQERRYLFNSIRDFVTRAARLAPLFLNLDDVHWADGPSLLLLDHIAEGIGELPVFILATYRDTDLDVERPLAQVLETLIRKRLARRLTIKPLREQEVEKMLAGLAGSEPPASLSKVIFEATDGNPFFVEEVFKHLTEEGRLFNEDGGFLPSLDIERLDVPEGVRLVVGRRLSRLGEEGTRALGAAALIGRGFSYELLRDLGEVDEDALLNALDEAENSHLIHSETTKSDVEYRFAHELIRIALIDKLSLPRRQRTHLRIAQSIETLHSVDLDEHVGDIAYHLYQAGAAADSTKTADYLNRAGLRALDAAAYEEAFRHFDKAIGLVEDNPELRATILHGLGAAHRSLFRLEEAMEVWREALGIYEDLGKTDRVGHMCFDVAYELAWVAKWAEALEMCGRGLHAIGEVRSEERVILEGLAGLVISLAGAYDDGLRRINQALELGEELGIGEARRGLGLSAKAIHHWGYLEFREMVEVGEEAANVLRSSGAAWDLASILGFLAQAYNYLGDFTRYKEIVAEAEPLAERLGHLGALSVAVDPSSYTQGVAPADYWDAWDEFVQSRLALTEQLSPDQNAFSTIFAALVDFWRGNWESAFEKATQAASEEGVGVFAGQAPGLGFLLRAYEGDRDAAMQIFRQFEDGLPPGGSPASIGAWAQLFSAIEGFYMLGEYELSARYYDIAQEPHRRGIRMCRADLRSIAAIVGLSAAAGEKWNEADEWFEVALKEVEALPHPVEALDTQRMWAMTFLKRDTKPPELVTKGLEEAIVGYRDYKMVRHEKLAVELRTQLSG